MDAYEFSNGIRDLLLKNPQIRMRPKTNKFVINGRLLFADLQIGISKPRNDLAAILSPLQADVGGS